MNPASPLIEDNVACVLQAAALVRQLGPDDYSHPHPAFYNAAVGGHMRHNIEHYLSFFAGLPDSRIDYDSRARDRLCETDPSAAADTLEQIAASLRELGDLPLDRPCIVRVNAPNDAPSDPSQWSGSTLRRELQFLLGHAIHHHAHVAAMCHALGVAPPQGFGMAPSTLLYHESQRRARANRDQPAGCAQ